MALTYLVEKLTDAVRTLATGKDGIKARLTHAAVYNLGPVKINEDVPEVLHDDYQELWDRLTRDPAESADEGKIHASIRNMSEEDAVDSAEDIYRMAYEAKRILEEERTARKQ